MAKRRKIKKTDKRARRKSKGGDHAIDRLYRAIDRRKGADPDSSATARLFSRGSQQIAKKLGEEAVEVVIEALRGNKKKLVLESADMLFHMLALWSASGVRPKVVWAELARREASLAETTEASHDSESAAP
jgi:phosphoribosyl-ATP pyrophosphohydrolase